MENVATSIIKMAQVSAGDKVIDMLKDHVEILVFNVRALANIVMLLHNDKKLKPEHVHAMQMYISQKCKVGGQQSGGTSMASDFFGYEHPAYQKGFVNEGSDVLHVNFDAGIARAPINASMSGGGGSGIMLDKATQKAITKNIRFSSTKVSAAFVGIIRDKLSCLARDIRAQATNKARTLTVAQLGKILKHDQYHVMH